MSDPKPPHGESVGEPVDETSDVDADVVSRAREGLADAEAARQAAAPHDPATVDAPVAPEPAETPRDASEQPVAAEPRRSEPETVVADEVVVEETAASGDGDREIPWYERDDVPLDPEPAVTPSEPVYEPPYTAPAAQPIFVQAPEAPRPRGNRGAAGAIGLLAAVAFAVLYLAAWLGIELLTGSATFADVPSVALGALATWALWVPVVVFFIAFWLLGAIINRGAWGHWVVWGLLVGVAAWGGHLLGQLFQAPFWMLTAREGAELVEHQALAPLAIVAFVLGRELTIWFGAWAAARGRRVTELNDEAQREYERTLEAGPQLHRA